MRVLTAPRSWPGEVTDDDLLEVYAAPELPWFRANMVTTVDGAATGETGRSGSVNNAVDKRVFDTLRSLADAIVVGAGTARTEEYSLTQRPIVVVSRRGEVPERLRGGDPGQLWLATCTTASSLADSVEILGEEYVVELGEDCVDVGRLPRELHARGMRHLLCEGGPSLLRDLLAAGVLDEIDATVVPRLVAGQGPRLLVGGPLEADVELHTLLEDSSTLLTRWLVAKADGRRAAQSVGPGQ